MPLSKTYTNQDQTGCCPKPNIKDWDEQEVRFENKPFIKMHTKSFMFMPLNMGKVMSSLQRTAAEAHATLPLEESMILSRDISPWKCEQLYAVNKPIEGAENVTLSGTYLTKVFEGPYQNSKHWYEQLRELATGRGKKPQKIYLFYTTCPKCAKHYSKNYTIGFIEV